MKKFIPLLGLFAFAACSCSASSFEIVSLNLVKERLLTSYYLLNKHSYDYRGDAKGPSDLKVCKYYGTAKNLYFVKISPNGPQVCTQEVVNCVFEGVEFHWWNRGYVPDVFDAACSTFISFEEVGERGLSKDQLTLLQGRFVRDFSLI